MRKKIFQEDDGTYKGKACIKCGSYIRYIASRECRACNRLRGVDRRSREASKLTITQAQRRAIEAHQAMMRERKEMEL